MSAVKNSALEVKNAEIEGLLALVKDSEEEDRKLITRIFIVVAIMLALIAGLMFAYTKVWQPMLQYKAAVAAMESGDYASAVVTFSRLGNYDDAPAQLLEARYGQATQYLENGKYSTARTTFEDLHGYKDSDALIAVCDEKILAEPSIGDHVDFGPYQWVVIDVVDGKMMLLALGGTGRQAYNEILEDTNWEQCDMRTWLNETFIDEFTPEEQALIAETAVETMSAQGEDGVLLTTMDKIFLLSLDEYRAYRVNIPRTDGYWWLRTPGNFPWNAQLLNYSGTPSLDGYFVDQVYQVRPAMWVTY